MPHPDLDTLLNALVPFAKRMLAKHGEFHPFAAALDADGEVRLVGAAPEGERSDSESLIALLEDGLRSDAQRGGIRAAGICRDVRVIPPGRSKATDAIGTRLEHRDGDAVDVFIAYRRGWLGKYRYGAPFASACRTVIFARSA